MDMQQCTIYLRAYKRKTIEASPCVYVKDVADVAAPPEVKARVEAMTAFCIPDRQHKGKYILTIVQLIHLIWQEYPKADIQSVGDPDMVIEYHPKVTKQKDLFEWFKVACICIVVFAGAMIAIMTYNTDTSLGQTFIILNRMMTGEEVDQPFLLTIPYSIGITVGVLTFFNHIGFKKITEDPTPMQVEMKKYEKEVEDCEIETITDKRRGEPS